MPASSSSISRCWKQIINSALLTPRRCDRRSLTTASIPAGLIFMQTIQLTQGFVDLVDDADYERVSAQKWYANVQPRGVYAARTDNRRTVYLHRFICGVSDPKVKVDHRNRNGLDNQRENLRDCSNGQNTMNQKKRRDGVSSKYKGVCWHKRDRKFQADIKLNGRSKF